MKDKCSTQNGLKKSTTSDLWFVMVRTDIPRSTSWKMKNNTSGHNKKRESSRKCIIVHNLWCMQLLNTYLEKMRHFLQNTETNAVFAVLEKLASQKICHLSCQHPHHSSPGSIGQLLPKLTIRRLNDFISEGESQWNRAPHTTVQPTWWRSWVCDNTTMNKCARGKEQLLENLTEPQNIGVLPFLQTSILWCEFCPTSRFGNPWPDVLLIICEDSHSKLRCWARMLKSSTVSPE